MDMHEDLRWLAENVAEWKLGATAVQKFGGSVDWLTKSLKDLGGVGELCFTPDQWQAARQQLEDERINNIARNGNDGDQYATPEEDEAWQAMDEKQKRSKYHVQIRPGVYVDVYDVLHAFGVTNPGDQHAIKKMLMPGKRGHKDAIQDRREAIQSLERAIELEEGQ